MAIADRERHLGRFGVPARPEGVSHAGDLAAHFAGEADDVLAVDIDGRPLERRIDAHHVKEARVQRVAGEPGEKRAHRRAVLMTHRPDVQRAAVAENDVGFEVRGICGKGHADLRLTLRNGRFTGAPMRELRPARRGVNRRKAERPRSSSASCNVTKARNYVSVGHVQRDRSTQVRAPPTPST